MSEIPDCLPKIARISYYYVDNPVQKMRYIFLQAYDENTETDTSASNYQSAYDGYSNDQLTWFQNTALNVDTGWTIIIVTHHLTSSDTETAGEYHAIIPSGQTRLAVYNAIDNYNGNGTIACVLEGHKHWDTSLITESGVPIITTTCDKWNMSSETGLHSREFGTIAEQAFDVGIIDKTQRKNTMVRIGGKAINDEYEEVEYREFDY